MTMKDLFKKIDDENKSLYAIDFTHKIFKGHFPKEPIVPGVMLLRLVKIELEQQLKTSVRLETVVSAKFLKTVTPQNTNTILEVKLTIEEEDMSCLCKASIYHDGNKVLNFSGRYIYQA